MVGGDETNRGVQNRFDQIGIFLAGDAEDDPTPSFSRQWINNSAAFMAYSSGFGKTFSYNSKRRCERRSSTISVQHCLTIVRQARVYPFEIGVQERL